MERQVLEALEELASELDAGKALRTGICNFVKSRTEEESAAEEVMGRLFREWPEYSGNVSYPVPGIYWKWDRWSKRTKYGQARRRLLAFMIKTLREELGQ